MLLQGGHPALQLDPEITPCIWQKLKRRILLAIDLSSASVTHILWWLKPSVGNHKYSIHHTWWWNLRIHPRNMMHNRSCSAFHQLSILTWNYSINLLDGWMMDDWSRTSDGAASTNWHGPLYHIYCLMIVTGMYISGSSQNIWLALKTCLFYHNTDFNDNSIQRISYWKKHKTCKINASQESCMRDI